jgi:hypothetical protein
MCRFVDRDMLMRYHWGLAVGHVYMHNHLLEASANGVSPTANVAEDGEDTVRLAAAGSMNEQMEADALRNVDDSDSEDPELSFETCYDDLELEDGDHSENELEYYNENLAEDYLLPPNS